MWSSFAHLPHDIASKWLVPIICGYVGSKRVYAGSRQLTIGCVSRLSNRRVGSRFLTRGIDDAGAVANSVETETFLLDESGSVASHCQLRGSVPVFWEQPGINFGQHKCDIIRKTAGSLSAAKRHFERAKTTYGQCHVVNLLGKGEGESKVSNEFHEVVKLINQEVSLLSAVVLADIS